MDADIIDRINQAVAAEQNLQTQLNQVKATKASLQSVLSVWENCKNDPAFTAYVQTVIDSFKAVTTPVDPAQTVVQ
jgi:enamine deaminase RidA (YjgF/YER057c/UK114 family)